MYLRLRFYGWNVCKILSAGGGWGGGGVRVLRISSDGDDRMGAKIRTPKKSLGPATKPKKSHAEFPSHKNFQKALNDVIIKIET